MTTCWIFILIVYCATTTPVSTNESVNNNPLVDALIEKLKHATWDEDEATCLKTTLEMLYGVKNRTLWAVWAWDAMQPPVGALYATRIHLGNYDQCLKAPWTSNQGPVLQYCLVDVVTDPSQPYRQLGPYDSAVDYLKMTTKYGRPLNSQTFGVCLPSSCKANTVGKVYHLMHQLSYLTEGNISVDPRDCQVAGDSEPITMGFVVFCGFVAALTMMVAISTYHCNNIEHTNTILESITKPFCLKTNVTELLKQSDNEIKVMNGMRFLSAVIVVVIHETMIRTSVLVGNTLDMERCFVAGAPLLAALSAGGSVSYPTVLLNQLKSNESSIHLDFETSTWIGSVHGLAGIPSILMPSLMQWRGRKLGFLLACSILVSGWIVAIAAPTVTFVILSECLQGLGSNSLIIISFLSISEMVAPQYREMFMQAYILGHSITMAISGILFQYLHWKTIAGIMLVPAALSLLMASMWPESPYWLAYKGEFSKCKRAFVWLRGSDSEASKELENLIYKQREHHILNKKKPTFSMRRLWITIKDKQFYVPACHMFVLDCLMYGSGILVMLVYCVDVFTKSTQNENARFYSALIANSMLSCGVLCSIIINKYISKKTLLLRASGVLILCLLGASLVTFLQSVGLVSKDSLWCLVFYVIYYFIASFGVSCTTYPLASSLMPVKYRGLGGALLIINLSVLHSASLKFAPYLFAYIDLWGTFLVYALIAVVCCGIIWKFLPDTEGKTLQEIENFYALGYFDDDIAENLDQGDIVVCDVMTDDDL